ncbi:hypothetical protein [Pseudactinotalea terrae]|uniref:hypothetical protein n=1 Tax=Pseudactinotalea terrae TaxID=1743262 RepID=UPI0012E2EA76|nr:hypothetical protein [Pseudactinotalea terrae]
MTETTRRQLRSTARRQTLRERRGLLAATVAAALLVAGGTGWLLLERQQTSGQPEQPQAAIDGTPVPVQEEPAPQEGLVLDTDTGELVDIATGQTVDPASVDPHETAVEPVTIRPGEVLPAAPAVLPAGLEVVPVGTDAWLVIDLARQLAEEDMALVAEHTRSTVEHALEQPDVTDPDLTRITSLEHQQSALAGTGLSLVAVFPAAGGYAGWTGLVDDAGHVYDGAGVTAATAQDALDTLHQWLTDRGVGENARIVITADPGARP